eukprot:TRINITY_DN5870_c0_g1_i10.p1 TRINITY_DN5870_c0_g1~~TRINITY_DN5870_c0_g1_i10.p1  ORF type:complete len:461 (-),score=75.71 TRINITY_DN5870_c0_g1_i10:406-1788(-)
MRARAKCGYIFKEGAQIYNWKKRFLSIEPDFGRISYYVKDDKKSKKGDIVIKTIKEVRRVDEYKGRKFIFGIVTTTGRTFYIQTSDEENRESWMKAIKEAAGLSETSTTPHVMQLSGKNTVHHTSTTSGTLSVETKVGVDSFETLKVIGRGGFGRVLLVRKRDTKKVYAMKVLKKAIIAVRGEIEHTRTEKSVMSKVDHPFLVKLHWSFQTEENLYFIMDFVNGGELFHHLSHEKSFSEPRAKFYAAQIVSGMAYLHSHGIIYRDLKPENILLSSSGNVIMTDFGLSKEGLTAADSRTATFCGTPEYLAPEIIKGDDYTKAIDWWSVGTLIFEMLTGLPPFYTEDEENMYHKIMSAELVIPSFFSPSVENLICQFLKRNPKERLQDPVKIRSHPWFRDIDWDLLERLEIPPPFVPQVRDDEDVTHIDDEFLQEDVNARDDDTPHTLVRKDDFENFTFAGQ